jgi:multidrug efflux pump subunit AcrB
MPIIRYFVEHPVLGNAILLLIFVFGFFSFQTIKTTFFPDVPSSNIIITAAYPGASPLEIEEGITLKIEDNLRGLTGVERVTSTSSENSAMINVELQSGRDVNNMLQDVKNAVDRVTSFPAGMEQISIFKMERTDFVISFALSGDVELTELKTAGQRIERDLLALTGISKVEISGFPAEEIEISLSETALRSYGLTFQQVATVIGNANIRMTGGIIKGDQEEFLIRTDNLGYYADDLENLVVLTHPNGSTVTLEQVATISDRWADDPNRSFFNGRSAVLIEVLKTNQEDMFEIAGQVHEYIDTFNSAQEELQINTLRDGSAVVAERIDILTFNGFLGIILVMLFLSFSLNARISFWVALSIPLSFAGMFMLGPLYGLTINVMSLMAMILVIGILVDDGIVIAESIYQHYEQGESPFDAAVNGTREVLPAVIAAVFTTIVFFAIFFFLEGHLGDVASDIAFVVIATLLISLVEGIFILPAHIAHSRALKRDPGKRGRVETWAERVTFWFRDKTYAPMLRWVMKRPLVAVTIPIALVIITFGAFKGSVIKTTFFPNIEMNNVGITLEMPAGTSAAVTDSLLTGIERSVWRVNDYFHEHHNPEVDLVHNIARRVGPGTNDGRLTVILVASEFRGLSSREVASIIRREIGPVPGAEKLQVGGAGHWGMPISIAISSHDITQLRQAKETLQSELLQISKLKDVINNDPPGLRELSITLNDKAYSLGLSPALVLSQVRSGFYGREAQRIIRGTDEVRLWVRYASEERATVEQLGDMRIRLADGREYPLHEIADLSLDRGVMALYHIDGERVVNVEADLANSRDSVPDILAEIQQDILPAIAEAFPDVTFDFEGQSRESNKTMNAFKLVLPPILVTVFVIVVFTFRSFLQSLLIFVLIPFSIVGVAWGHYIQGYTLSLLSMFGVIALAGIVINDSLVLVSTMNRMLKQGKDFSSALYDAGISRFRPVLLTTLTTVAGLGPLIFETSHQAQFLSPMAISVAYGLLFGTLLTLLMLPALLVLLNSSRAKMHRLFTRQLSDATSLEPAVLEITRQQPVNRKSLSEV